VRPLALIAVLAALSGVASAETVRIGIIKQTNTGMVFLAQDRGYFAAEGLIADIVYFDASLPIAVATTSGDIDFGVTAFTAGFYQLAGEGTLRIIAAQVSEVPGFHDQGWFISGEAYAAGVRAVKDVPGHTVALTQVGASSHYALGLAAEKYGFDLSKVQVLPLQSLGNMVTALVGGRVDFAPMSMAPAVSARLDSGEIKLAAWVGDETPWQFGGVFTATKTANERRDFVERFLRAYRKGARDFHDAFADVATKSSDNPRTAESIAIIAHNTGQTADQVESGNPFVDADARLDAKDVLHQIAWYKGQNFVKGNFDPKSVLDMRYVLPLP
jgi:NitT/TauT family transport system substrate-binding protein